MTTEFTFTSNLADSAKLLSAVRQAAVKQGGITLLKAPCNAGKTYSVLKSVAPELPEGRNLILAVPNVVQALQNRKYGAQVVTGDSFTIESAGTVTSSTYDKVQLLTEWSDDELSRTTLVVDEAHMLVTEQTYRRKAIYSLLAVVRRILDAGGSVIMMTATPRRIIDEDFMTLLNCTSEMNRITCFKKDNKGNHLPGIQAKKMCLIRKPEEDKMPIYVQQLLIRNKLKGKKSLLLYNNKKTIDRLEHTINELGITSYRITADDKGFWQELIYDNNGVPQEKVNRYANEAYGDLIEHECLPEADVFLCTSVVEAGTNIKGIRTADGNIDTPPNLIPIYIASQPSEFDIDKVHQFLSRVRFSIEEAWLVLGTLKSEDALDSARVKSYGFAKSARESVDRANQQGWNVDSMPDIAGRVGGTSVQFDGKQYVTNALEVLDQKWNEYNRQLYCLTDLTQTLENEYEIPVIESTLAFLGDAKKMSQTSLDQETCEALRTACNDFDAFNSIREESIPDGQIPAIKELLKHKDGYRVCICACKLAKLCTIRKEMLAEIVIATVNAELIYIKEENTHVALSHVKEPGAVKALDYFERKGFRILSRRSQRELEKFFKYMRQETGEAPYDRWLGLSEFCPDAEVRKLYRYFVNSNRMTLLTNINMHGTYSNNLKKLMQIGAELAIQELKELEKELDCIEFNKKDIQTPPWNKAYVEYLILRYPEKYLRTSCDGIWINLWKRDYPGRKDLKGYLTADDIQKIAEGMSASVQQLTHSRRTYQYKSKDVFKLIRMIYRIKVVDPQESIRGIPNKIEVKDLRKEPHQLGLS